MSEASSPMKEVSIFFKTLGAAFKEFFNRASDRIERKEIDTTTTKGQIYNYVNLVFFILGYPFLLLRHMLSGFVEVITTETLYRFPKGRREKALQDRIFTTGMAIVFLLILIQPADPSKKIFVISFLVFLICYYAIMAMGLNIQTGATGIVNFGVIFFVGIGMVSSAVLSTKGISLFGMKILLDPITSMLIGMVISAAVGYLLAYPGLRLRTDYFAIITIALGEFLKRMLLAEPTFQTDRPWGSSIGISNIPAPFKDTLSNNRFGIAYDTVLAMIGIIFMIIVLVVSQLLLRSPYGRVLRGIREDEQVVDSYGYDVFKYKASVLAIGGAIFAMAGSMWVWKVSSIFPGTIAVITTFYVWAAFIIGGKGNSKGMILGASVIAITQYSVDNLSTISPAERPRTFLAVLDFFFRIIAVDIGGTLFGDSTWRNTFTSREDAFVDTSFIQLFIVGALIILFLRYMPDGILPELPYTPKSESHGRFEDEELLIEKMRKTSQVYNKEEKT